MVANVEREPFTAELDASDIEKGTYPHYMLKEMDEQPTVIRKIIQAYRNEDGELAIDEDILDALKKRIVFILLQRAQAIMRVLVGKQYFEKMAGIPVEVHISSEFGYNMPLLIRKAIIYFHLTIW